jgi:phosphoglycerol transferase
LLEEAAVATGAVVITLLIAAIVLQAWSLSFSRPNGYDPDAVLTATLVKSVLHHGWYLNNSNLGAPFGQQLYDFPLGGDNLHFVLMKVLGIVSSNVFVVVNLYSILTFILITLSGYVVLRCLRVSRVVSAGLSILYALLPYHFLRGESHLFLSGYYGVPLAVLLVVWALGESPLVWRKPSAHSRGIRLGFDRRRSLAALGCCIVLGSTDSYYAVFAVVALLGCGFLVAIGRRAWRSLATCAALAAIILVVLAINLSPSVVYDLVHGADPIAAIRYPLESELYGLRIAGLFLPVAGHRFAPFADFTANYDKFPIPGEGTEALGAIFAIGLIVLLARGLAGRFQASSEGTWRQRTLNTVALAALVAIIVGAATGLSGIFALAVTPQIRAWGRISVLIAFCAAAGLGLLLDQLFGRLRSLGARWGVPSLVMLVLVIVGSFDQTTSRDVPDSRHVAAIVRINGGFVQTVQDRLPRGAMVFQLPYQAFPENGTINRMQDYEEAQGYLFSDTLRWSYGAMKGRPEDFSRPLSQYPLPVVARAVAVAGFAAVYVDRTGYADNGVAVDNSLRALVGPPIVTSSNGTLELYDLRPLAAQLHGQFPPAELASLSYAALHQVTVTYGSGFYLQENSSTQVWRWASGRSQIELMNPDSRPRDLRFQGVVVTPGTIPSSVTIAGGGVSETFSTTSAGTPLSLVLRVPPGKSVINLTTNAPRQPGGDIRYLHLQLVNPFFSDPDLTPLQG